MTATNLPSTINFLIPTENVQTVVALLLSNGISFTLTYSSYLETAPNATEQIEEMNTDNSIPLTQSSPESSSIETIYRKYIEENIEQMPPNEAQIAAEIGIPLVKFKNEFKIAYGKPFYQLYMEKRMEYAAQLLQKGYRANKVSLMVGYGEKSAIKFSKMFQKHFGMTPKKYQMNQR